MKYCGGIEEIGKKVYFLLILEVFFKKLGLVLVVVKRSTLDWLILAYWL